MLLIVVAAMILSSPHHNQHPGRHATHQAAVLLIEAATMIVSSPQHNQHPGRHATHQAAVLLTNDEKWSCPINNTNRQIRLKMTTNNKNSKGDIPFLFSSFLSAIFSCYSMLSAVAGSFKNGLLITK